MTPGVSTACLYPFYTEEAFKVFASRGVLSTEVFVNCAEEIAPDYIHELRLIADEYGVKILSVHPYTSPMDTLFFFSGYERRFCEGMELYRKYYEAANILGANAVVFHGCAKDLNISYGEYFDRFGRLLEDSISNGVMLCHENVSRCTSHSIGFFKAMAKALPKAEFILDIKQAVRAGEDVFEFANAMAGRIRHVHFSDHNSDHDCLPPGKGTFNIPDFIELIRLSGFDGGIIVELYRENFGEIVELLDSYQQLCAHISTVLKNAENGDVIRQLLT